MKIGILTIHFGRNYGSVLQAYALNKHLQNKEINVRTLDYIPERFNFKNRYYVGRGKSFPLRVVASIVKFPINYKQYKIFRDFVEKNIRLTPVIRDTRKFIMEVLQQDIVVVGSDQVWNSDYNGSSQDIYLLTGIDGNVKKVAYAASFGRDSLPADEIESVKNKYKRFDAISVRETSGQIILKNMDVDACICIDPVFLIKKSEWECLCADNLVNKPYILIYALGGKEEEVLAHAYELSKRKGLSVIYIGFRYINDKRINKQYRFASPEEFLSLIKYAECVITNSFHATAFSIIFEKKFITVKRDSYNNRLTHILGLCDLEQHLCNKEFSDREYELIDVEIPYQIVKQRLNLAIEQSELFIESNITRGRYHNA